MRSVPLRNFVRSSVALALALLLPWMALGQEQQQPANGKAAIKGTVTDQTQAVVTGAKIVLSNGAGLTQETRSDEKGTGP